MSSEQNAVYTRRRPMFSFYAYCVVVDIIVDIYLLTSLQIYITLSTQSISI